MKKFNLYIIIILLIIIIILSFILFISKINHNKKIKQAKIKQDAFELKVKSLGILYLIVPIGAFCEPDEEELKKTETAKRMRVYAAGPLANFVVALVCIMLFSFVFMSAVQPASQGIGVLEVYDNSPADKLGIKTGSTIISLNSTNFTDYSKFEDRFIKYLETVNEIEANDTVLISYYYNGNFFYNEEITVANKYNYTGNASHFGKGQPGIYSFIDNEGHLEILKNPFTTRFPYGFLFFYILPLTGYFEGYNPIVSPFTGSYEITGPLGILPHGLFWGIINALYWIFWLNLAVGLFNVLPMIPLDGGFLFNDVVGSFVRRIRKGISDEKREKIVKNVSLVISLLILLAIIFPFIIKYI